MEPAHLPFSLIEGRMQQFTDLNQYAIYNLLSKSRFVCHLCTQKTPIVNEKSIQLDRDAPLTLPCQSCEHKACSQCQVNPKVLRSVAYYEWQPVPPEPEERSLFVHVCCGCGDALKVEATIQTNVSAALQKYYVDFRRSKCRKCRHRCCEKCACLIEVKAGKPEIPKRSASTRSKASTVRSAGGEQGTSMLQRVSSSASRASSRIVGVLAAPFKARRASDVKHQREEDEFPLITRPKHENCRIPNCILCNALKSHRAPLNSPQTDTQQTGTPETHVFNQSLERWDPTRNSSSKEATPGNDNQKVEDLDGFVLPPGSEYVLDHPRGVEERVKNWMDQLKLDDDFTDPNEPLEDMEPLDINPSHLDVEPSTSRPPSPQLLDVLDVPRDPPKSRKRIYTKEHKAYKQYAEELRDTSSSDS